MGSRPPPGTATTKLDLIDAFTSTVGDSGEYGIRYEFDYNRGNPGYIKDLYINNVIPEPSNNVLTYGFYGNIKQGEVAEFSDDTDSFDVTLPGYIYYAKNGSTELVFSKDVSFSSKRTRPPTAVSAGRTPTLMAFPRVTMTARTSSPLTTRPTPSRFSARPSASTPPVTRGSSRRPMSRTPTTWAPTALSRTPSSTPKPRT